MFKCLFKIVFFFFKRGQGAAKGGQKGAAGDVNGRFLSILSYFFSLQKSESNLNSKLTKAMLELK